MSRRRPPVYDVPRPYPSVDFVLVVPPDCGEAAKEAVEDAVRGHWPLRVSVSLHTSGDLVWGRPIVGSHLFVQPTWGEENARDVRMMTARAYRALLGVVGVADPVEYDPLDPDTCERLGG